MSDYDVVLMPFAPYFRKGLWERIKPWIGDGGTLIALGPCGLYDEFGFDDPDSPVRPLMVPPFPKDQLNTRATWTWDRDGLTETHPIGQGTIVQVSSTMADILLKNRLREEFLRLFADHPPAATSPDTPAEVELRTDRAGGHYVFALNPETDLPIEGTICVQKRFTGVDDLGILAGFPVRITGHTESTTSFCFRLAAGQYTFFRLTDLNR